MAAQWVQTVPTPAQIQAANCSAILQQLVKGPHPFRAVPMPWIVAKAMVGLAWRAVHHDVAVLILVGFCYFLRTMEFVTSPVANVVWRPLRLLSLLIVPRRQSSISNLCCCGTGLWPASLAMPFHDCLAGSVFGLPQQGIFAHVSLAWWNMWVSKTGFSLYSIRRGGATHAYTQTRDLHYVTVQGRWRDVKTPRIYLDDARAILVKLSFPPPIAHLLQHSGSTWSFFRVASPKASNGCDWEWALGAIPPWRCVCLWARPFLPVSKVDRRSCEVGCSLGPAT